MKPGLHANNIAFMAAWLPFTIRMTALGFFIFFFVLTLQSLHLAHFGETYLSLVRWEENGESYELMICAIYLVWSLFLWRSAAAPYDTRFFLDFTVAANVAHFGIMFFQGILMEGKHQHLYGDIALAWAGFTPLIIFWAVLRCRRKPFSL